MRQPIRLVAPFRPFPPETGHHHQLADFDWMDAIRMMSSSARRACGGDFRVLTDVDTDLPFPTFSYRTRTRRLMLWYLEVAACYLDSADFDRDTISLDSDQLIYQDLTRWFSPNAEMAILVRSSAKLYKLPILNGVQWWRVKAKARLAEFYWRALALAETLPESEIAWGADTVALWRLLSPLAYGIYPREGVRAQMIDTSRIIEPLSLAQIHHLESGLRVPMRHPVLPVLDFRNLRKRYMRRVYDQTLARRVEAAA